jgi:hypothetical protein
MVTEGIPKRGIGCVFQASTPERSATFSGSVSFSNNAFTRASSSAVIVLDLQWSTKNE